MTREPRRLPTGGSREATRSFKERYEPTAGGFEGGKKATVGSTGLAFMS